MVLLEVENEKYVSQDRTGSGAPIERETQKVVSGTGSVNVKQDKFCVLGSVKQSLCLVPVMKDSFCLPSNCRVFSGESVKRLRYGV